MTGTLYMASIKATEYLSPPGGAARRLLPRFKRHRAPGEYVAWACIPAWETEYAPSSQRGLHCNVLELRLKFPQLA